MEQERIAKRNKKNRRRGRSKTKKLAKGKKQNEAKLDSPENNEEEEKKEIKKFETPFWQLNDLEKMNYYKDKMPLHRPHLRYKISDRQLREMIKRAVDKVKSIQLDYLLKGEKWKPGDEPDPHHEHLD